MPNHVDDMQDHAEQARDLMIHNAVAATAPEQTGNGICRGCGVDIPAERLAIFPKAAHCFECQGELE